MLWTSLLPCNLPCRSNIAHLENHSRRESECYAGATVLSNRTSSVIYKVSRSAVDLAEQANGARNTCYESGSTQQSTPKGASSPSSGQRPFRCPANTFPASHRSEACRITSKTSWDGSCASSNLTRLWNPFAAAIARGGGGLAFRRSGPIGQSGSRSRSRTAPPLSSVTHGSCGGIPRR